MCSSPLTNPSRMRRSIHLNLLTLKQSTKYLPERTQREEKYALEASSLMLVQCTELKGNGNVHTETVRKGPFEKSSWFADSDLKYRFSEVLNFRIHTLKSNKMAILSCQDKHYLIVLLYFLNLWEIIW